MSKERTNHEACSFLDSEIAIQVGALHLLLHFWADDGLSVGNVGLHVCVHVYA